MTKTYDGILGLVVGDALGVPVEFLKRGDFFIEDMVGYGSHNVPAGTWSDDSAMCLATLDSLRICDGINPVDIMNRFVDWLVSSTYTPHGYTWGVGNIIYHSLLRYMKGASVETCGGTEVKDNGNGALMRILPIAFVPHTDADVDAVSGLTHNHRISKVSCRNYIKIADTIIEGGDWRKLITDESLWKDELAHVPQIPELDAEDLVSSGYVVDTLVNALWCLWHTDNYKDCVLAAVNLGYDTDTVAAVAGGLAGLLYGADSIPQEWVNKIPRLDYIKELCDVKDEEHTCCICGAIINGFGNNPWPVVQDDNAICCDNCNFEKVVPARVLGVW